MNKRIIHSLIALWSAVLCMPLITSAWLVNVGWISPQTMTGNFLWACQITARYAIYEWQSFKLNDSWVPNTTVSNWEVLDTTRVGIWNPSRVLGDTLSSNTLGGLLSPFTYKSNGKPGTQWFGINLTSIITHKQDAFNYAIKPSPATTRTSPLAQVVHYLSVRQILSIWGSSYLMTYMDNNFTTAAVNVNPDRRNTPINDVQCQNFYIAKCGDGVRDNPSKPWNATTDGKNGILINGQILPWISVLTPTPAEVCDGNDGTPSGYTCNSSCQLVQTIVQPNCTLTPAVQNISCGQSAVLNYSSTNTVSISNLVNISGGIIDPQEIAWFRVNPTQTTIYSFTVNGMPGSTPVTCSARINVAVPQQPNCTLTPASQTITAGQSAVLNYSSTNTVSISNLINIPSGIIDPLEIAWFRVTPTQTTTYSFTANGGACTIPKVCTATINVLTPAPTCNLTIDHTSIISGETAIVSGSYTNALSASLSPAINRVPLVYPNRSDANMPVHPITNTTYILTVTGTNGTTIVCPATLIVRPPAPTCSLTANTTGIRSWEYIVLSGWYTNAISAYITPTIGGLSFIYPNRSNNNIIVYPTIDTTYRLTVTGIDGTTIVCPVAVNVRPIQSPQLWIHKTLLVNTAYHSGDLVWFRIDFKNIGNGTAHNIVLTDYLPVSLRYISREIFGIPSYNSGIGMLWPIPGYTYSITGYIYSWFDLAPGSGWYMIITGQVISYELCDSTLNTSFIESAEVQPPLYSGALFSCDTPPAPTTELTITKDINNRIFYPGEYITFRIGIANNGPGVAQSIKVGDIWPNTSCIIPVSFARTLPSNMSPGLYDNTTNPPYERTLSGTLEVGQTVYLYLTGQVANTPNCARDYLNTGTLTYIVNGGTKTGQAVVPFLVPPVWTGWKCSSLAVHGSNIVVVDENDYQGDASFTCYSEGSTPQNITIDCGNGQRDSASNVSSLNTICHFDEHTVPVDRKVQCFVDNQTQDSCIQNMIIDQQSFGICGDGHLDEWEDCDLWEEDNLPIEAHLDAEGRVNAGNYANNGYSCHNCDMRKKDTFVPMAACFSLGNNNISIQDNEILPFRWKVDLMDSKTTTTCGDSTSEIENNNGKIIKSSLECEFRVFNGKYPEQGKWSDFGSYNADTVTGFTIPCNEDSWTSNGDFGEPKNLFKYFYDNRYTGNIYSLQKPFGRYSLPFKNIDLENIYGEYNIALYKVTYDYCKNGERVSGKPIDRVCETDFAVTKPYLAQKSSFGLVPKTTTIDLSKYLDIFGSGIVKKTDLDKIMVLNAETYKWGTNVTSLMTSFINKYDKLAISVPLNKVPSLNKPGIMSIKIVPQQKIYIISGKTGTTTDVSLNPSLVSDTPFTIVTRNINLIIEGNLTTNGMFLVDNGTISFQEVDGNRCKGTQTVQGIFVTNEWFAADTEGLSNDSPNRTRCPWGWLYVKGVLIGENIQDLVDSRRSQLNHRFSYNGYSATDPNVLRERRNEIFNGASVLIEYSPSLRTALPPGASEFTNALDVYKR